MMVVVAMVLLLTSTRFHGLKRKAGVILTELNRLRHHHSFAGPRTHRLQRMPGAAPY